MKRYYIITGGTMVHIAPHFSLCAPAYGTVGSDLAHRMWGKNKQDDRLVHHVPTYMAHRPRRGTTTDPVVGERYKEAGIDRLETNDELSKLVDALVAHPETRCIVLAAAICDFEPSSIRESFSSSLISVRFGKDQERLSSKEFYDLTIQPTDKIIGRIRQERKDIFLVGFKTTAGTDKKTLYDRGLELLKDNSANLVVANDIQNHTNLILTPEGFPYEYEDRDLMVRELADMIFSRTDLTFTRTETLDKHDERLSSHPDDSPAMLGHYDAIGVIPKNFSPVLRFLVEGKAFKAYGASTPGHFGCKMLPTDLQPIYSGVKFIHTTISSARHADHNKVFEQGMVKVIGEVDGKIQAIGRKPSAGEHTQQEIYKELGDQVHSVVHFHSPLREEFKESFPWKSQQEYECGSHQCAVNTMAGMTEMEPGIFAVHLRGHGPNIAFHKDVSPLDVWRFIWKHWDLDKGLEDILED